MKNDQYTVLLDSRPLRVAFLLDIEMFQPRSDRFFALVGAIVKCNNIQWGGRTNPIIFFNGELLSDKDWQLIEATDPDRILAFAPLQNQLLSELERRLNPCRIDVSDQSKSEPDRIAVQIDGGIGMPPTKENFRALAPPNLIGFGGSHKLVVFGFGENCDPDVQRFVRLNFGTYDQWIDPKTKSVRRNLPLERMLGEIETVNYTVADIKSLVDALTELAGRMRPRDSRPGVPFAAPYQFSSIFLRDWPAQELQHAYQIVVGDEPNDLSEHWNGARWKSNWAATHIHQLWVPKMLIQDGRFQLALHDWLSRYRTWDAGWHAELLSTSLSDVEVNQIIGELRQIELALPFSFVNPTEAGQRFERIQLERGKYKRFVRWTSDDDVLRFSASFPEDRLSIPHPEPLQGQQRSGSWMVDVQLEHLSDNRSAGREQGWWNLPRTNSAFWSHTIFRAPARINATGRFSVEVQSCEHPYMRTVKPHLKIQLPSDNTLIELLIAPTPMSVFSQMDARTTLVKPAPVVGGCRVSTKGYYLASLLGLFGHFWMAKSFCERRFWRALFSELAGHRMDDDETLRLKVGEMLSDSLAANSENEQRITAISNEILLLVRGRLQGHSLSFTDCLQKRGRLERKPPPQPLVYPQGRTMVHRSGLAPVTIADLEVGLERLLDRGILRLGIENECPQCKVQSWYHVDDMRQQITCIGCGYVHSLKPQETWKYSLNSLAQMSVSQGVLGVLHALTALESSAILSFFAFSPSLDLFRPGDKMPWHEIDVACIADGEFVIGEVKEGFVQKKAFDDLAEISEALRPDRAIIFLPLEHAMKQQEELRNWLGEMKTRLAPIGVSAEIFTLPEF